MENMRFTSGRVGENVWRLEFGVRRFGVRQTLRSRTRRRPRPRELVAATNCATLSVNLLV